MIEKQLSEQESLNIITEMIGKAKMHFHESGASTILWGVVISFCSFFSFAQSFWKFDIGFNIWYLTCVAIIPQVWIVIQENKRKITKTYEESAIDTIWMVYVITIAAMLVYANVTYFTSPGILAQNDLEIFSKNVKTGEIKPFKIFAPSFSSIMMAVYAFPTLATGLIAKYRPFLAGAGICYAFFIVSLFTSFTYDMLLSGLAAVCCWLIPGLMLRRKYLDQRSGANV
ncbi:MAG: hypothetical protein KF746_00265 [Chitinophagaceae bacterium]|nr:hypothetical protein [Chitinophagaceae bacterium]